MYELTLGEVRADLGIRNVSGVCASSDEFAAQVNDVTRLLMRRGGWWQKEVLMRVCIQGCRIVWPRQVGTVLGIRFCKGGTLQIKNNWWAVYGYKGCDNWWGSSVDAVMRDDDTAPCYNEITGNTGKYLRWNVVKRNDIGKTMRVYGFQYGGQPLQEKNASDVWVPGITLTAAAPYVTSTTLVTKITGIKIEEGMQGMNYLYQVDPTTGDLIGLGEYQPYETTPDYRVSKIENIGAICATEDDNGRKMRYADALVKLQYIKAHTDSEPVMMSNLDALKYGIQAYRLDESNDDVQAEVKWSKAIRELNMEIRDKNPALQTVVRVNDMSAHCGIYNPI